MSRNGSNSGVSSSHHPTLELLDSRHLRYKLIVGGGLRSNQSVGIASTVYALSLRVSDFSTYNKQFNVKMPRTRSCMVFFDIFWVFSGTFWQTPQKDSRCFGEFGAGGPGDSCKPSLGSQHSGLNMHRFEEGFVVMFWKQPDCL